LIRQKRFEIEPRTHFISGHDRLLLGDVYGKPLT